MTEKYEKLKNNETVKEFKDKLNTLTNEQQKFLLFKFFIEEPEKAKEYSEYFFDGIENFKKNYFISSMMSEFRKNNFETKEYVNKKITIEENYKALLQKCKLLAKELNLNNSLEIANLYTWLLWNGFFSKNKELKFQSHNRVLIPGNYSHDIMSGIGVCLNFSDMLSDFLNEFDFSSATLINYTGDDCERSYKVDIERVASKTKLSYKMMTLLIKPIIKKVGNHAFNLIKENDKLYIYDSTNLSAFKLEDKNKCIMIPGKGIVNLKPYFSYYINLSKKSTDALNFLHSTDYFEAPYNKKDFIVTWEECFELFLNNTSLLDDFYNEVKDDIMKISAANSQSKQLLKEYKKNNREKSSDLKTN